MFGCACAQSHVSDGDDYRQEGFVEPVLDCQKQGNRLKKTSRELMAVAAKTAVEDRVVQLGPGLSLIPERLLLAHARGEVLFICGAGISRPAGLPDFRQLVLDVYAQLDASTYSVLNGLPPSLQRVAG